MGDSRFTDTSSFPQLPAAEIHLNKDFISSDKRTQWTDFYSGPMYNNTTPQYPPPGYDNTYQYQYSANYGYQGYAYQNQPVPPGDTYTHQGGGGWTPHQGGYSTTAAQQQHQQAEPKMEVVQEIQQQKATLTKQREDYVRKALVLHRELDQLKQQKQELASDERSEKELRSVLKDNDKLQDQINGKLKAIMNVIEMLSSIIKDGKKLSDLEADLQKPKEEPQAQNTDNGGSESPKVDAAKQRNHSSRSEKESRNEKAERDSYKKERHSYVYYDTGLHWCRSCDKFPDTAKDFLQHLHAEEHQEKAKENEVDTTPWHKLPTEPLLPSYDDAPKKRIPIKGLQFFISAPSWYCKLCDVWIGDLHCASHHLKSQVHFHNYENFVNENPQWEAQWLKDRETARSRNEKNEGDSSESDQERKKKKKRRRRSSNESLLKDKKKKKRSKKKKKRKKADSSDSSSSSSSSSDSSSDEDEGDEKKDQDTGKSIRVAMRNMQQVKSIMDEDMSKWSVLEKLMGDMKKPEKPDETINQWMTVTQPVPDKEKNLLDSLKDRMKAKNDLEKARMAELDLRRREKEREDQEQERKRRQAREDAEHAERERKRKEQDVNKVLDKDRSHIRFRPRDQHSRRRRSSSAEPDRRDRSHHRDSREREREREPSPQFRQRRDYKASSPEKDFDDSNSKKKPPGPPSYKKLPFIGRMPLFKKKPNKTEERHEISKEDYEPVRKTRFETGMLARAFIPRPDVVCFPVLSSIPPMMAPPEPTAVEQTVAMKPEVVEAPPPPPPKAPKIRKEEVVAPPPPPPPDNHHNEMMMHHQVMESEYYQNMYETSQYETNQYQASHYETSVPHPPLEPPPLPPDDDLAMLGICADDMAAQTF